MRHVNFAKEIVDFAKTITPEQKGLLKNKIGELMGKCENSKEFILSMGYAIHFADTPSTPLLFAPIFMVMGIDEASENARAVYSNAKTINTVTSPRPVGRGFPDRLPLPACYSEDFRRHHRAETVSPAALNEIMPSIFNTLAALPSRS